jgi:hypothetical protein
MPSSRWKMSPSLPFGQLLRRFAFLRFRSCYWFLGGLGVLAVHFDLDGSLHLGGLAVKGSFHFVTPS